MYSVYKIKNILNGKYYVGRSSNIIKRFSRHRRELIKNEHHCKELQLDYNLYGVDNFEYEIINEFLTEEESICHEKYYLDNYFDDLYNTSINASAGGDNISYNPDIDTIRKNISEGLKVRFCNLTDLERKIISDRFSGENNPMYGKNHSEESKKLISDKIKAHYKTNDSYRKGKTFEELFSEEKCLELKSNLSNIAKSRTGDKNPFYGKTHSEETKNKISEKRKGVLPSNIRPVLIDGIEYESATAAARCLGVVTATILHRIKSKNEKFKNYYYK